MFGPFRINFRKKRNNGSLGCITLILFIALFVGAWIWASNNAIDHVEDINGPEDKSLSVITDMNIVNMNYGSRGFSKTEGRHNVKFFSKRFTGVQELFYNDYFGDNNTVTLKFSEFVVTEGNVVLVVVNEGKHHASQHE